MAYMDRDHNGFLSDFERDADGDGIPNMDEGGSKDEARITKSQPADDPNYYDYGLFTPVLHRPRREADQRRRPAVPGHQPGAVLLHRQAARPDQDAEGRSARLAVGRLRRRRHPRRRRTTRTTTTSRTSRSTCRRSRRRSGTASTASSTPASPTPTRASACSAAPTSTATGSPTATTPTTTATACPTRSSSRSAPTPLRADSDSDGVSDGYEYWSALDLNGAAHPFPGKAPYPNALDGTDADLDFDGDGLTLKQEYQAWNYSGRPAAAELQRRQPVHGRHRPARRRQGRRRRRPDELRGDQRADAHRLVDRAVRRPERSQGDAVPRRRTAASPSRASSTRTPTATASSTATTTRTTTATRTGSRPSRARRLARTLHASTSSRGTGDPAHQPAGAREPVQPVQADRQRRLPQPRCRWATTEPGEDWLNNVTPTRAAAPPGQQPGTHA